MVVDLACQLVITNLHRLAGILSAFIVVTNSDAALAAKAFGPEALNGRRPVMMSVIIREVGALVNIRACHAVVGKEEPEAEDGLDKNVENGISNDFGIDISNA